MSDRNSEWTAESVKPGSVAWIKTLEDDVREGAAREEREGLRKKIDQHGEEGRFAEHVLRQLHMLQQQRSLDQAESMRAREQLQAQVAEYAALIGRMDERLVAMSKAHQEELHRRLEAEAALRREQDRRAEAEGALKTVQKNLNTVDRDRSRLMMERNQLEEVRKNLEFLLEENRSKLESQEERSAQLEESLAEKSRTIGVLTENCSRGYADVVRLQDQLREEQVEARDLQRKAFGLMEERKVRAEQEVAMRKDLLEREVALKMQAVHEEMEELTAAAEMERHARESAEVLLDRCRREHEQG